MEIKNYDEYNVRKSIRDCEEMKHKQQVSFSTYHDCLTQICFSCKLIRTSMKEEDIK